MPSVTSVAELASFSSSANIANPGTSISSARVAKGIDCYEAVSDRSLGAIFRSPTELSREVRADQYGIRTFLARAELSLKFEVVREARIDLDAVDVRRIPVPCLTRKHCFAEKFLANADRGLDASTLSRDLIDLAFMIDGWNVGDARDGLAIAESAYGRSVRRAVKASRRMLREDKVYRNRCVEGLGIQATKTLNAGLNALGTFE